MSLAETMSDRSGVIASDMLEISAIHEGRNVNFNLRENTECVCHREKNSMLLQIRSGYLSLQRAAVWVRLHTSPAHLLRFD